MASLMDVCSLSTSMGLQGTANVQKVYTQHKTHLSTVVESLMKGRLKEARWVFSRTFFV